MRAMFQKNAIAAAILAISTAAFAAGQSDEMKNVKTQPLLVTSKIILAANDANTQSDIDRNNSTMDETKTPGTTPGMNNEDNTTDMNDTGNSQTQQQSMPGEADTQDSTQMNGNEQNRMGQDTQQPINGDQQQNRMSTNNNTNNNVLMSKKAGDITSMKVSTSDDKDIGKVNKVVVDPVTNRVYAVVSVGGFMGVGSKKVTMEIDKMQLRDNKLIASDVMSKDDLKNRAEYNSANFRELDDNQTLSQFSSTTRMPRS